MNQFNSYEAAVVKIKLIRKIVNNNMIKSQFMKLNQIIKNKDLVQAIRLNLMNEQNSYKIPYGVLQTNQNSEIKIEANSTFFKLEKLYLNNNEKYYYLVYFELNEYNIRLL